MVWLTKVNYVKIANECIRGDMENVLSLGSDLNVIMNHLVGSGEISLAGKFYEWVIQLGVFFRTPWVSGQFGDVSLLSMGTTSYSGEVVRDIRKITSGVVGKVDLAFWSENKAWFFSMKYRQHDQWAHMGSHELLGATLHNQFTSRKSICGVIVRDKDALGKKDDNHKHITEIYDARDMATVWEQVYRFFKNHGTDPEQLNAIAGYGRKSLALRPHQAKAVERALEIFKSEVSCLLAHIPRSGKSIIAIMIAKQLMAEKVLLLTHYPILNSQWVEDTIRAFVDFADFQVINVSGDKVKKVVFPDGKVIVLISLQDAKNWSKKKFKSIQGIVWDLVILDEVHRGTGSELAKDLFSQVKRKKTLALSATPMVNMARGEFHAGNTDFFGIEQMEQYRISHPDIYGDFPKINLRLLDIAKAVKDDFFAHYDLAEGFTWTKLLAHDGSRFVWQKHLVEFIDRVFKGRDGFAKLSISYHNANNALVFLPNATNLEVLRDLIKERVGDSYNVEFTNSMVNSSEELFKLTRNNFGYADSDPLIILAIGQLSTGVTLPKCDTVIFMNDMESVAEYVQRMYRCCSPSDGKVDVNVFDFSPSRSLLMLQTYAEMTMTGDSTSDKVCTLLDCINIFSLDEETKGYSPVNLQEFLETAMPTDVQSLRNLFASIGLPEHGDLSFLTNFLVDATIDGKNRTDLGDKDLKGKNHKREDEDGKEAKDDKEPKVEQGMTDEEKAEAVLGALPWVGIFAGLPSDSLQDWLDKIDDDAQAQKDILEVVIGTDMSWEQAKKVYSAYESADLHMRVSKFYHVSRREPELLAKFMQSNDRLKKVYGEVFTPMELVEEMLSKLPKEVWQNPNLKWLDPAVGTGNFLVVLVKKLMEGLRSEIQDPKERKKHILENMVYAVDIQRKNIMLCSRRLDPEGEFSLNLVCENSLEFDYWGGMKFDVVVGNPPYNASGKTSTGNTLYDKFVKMALNRLLSKDGYLCFVHPPSWRKPLPKTNLWEMMSAKQILYLEIHDVADGKKVFGNDIGTRYDWYVLQNSPNTSLTKVIDEKGGEHSLDLSQWPWLPNFAYDEIGAILAKEEEPVCEIMYDRSAYGSDKKGILRNKTEAHIYPCVNSTAKTKGLVLCWSEYNDKGFFGIPKIIFGQSGNLYPLIDVNGNYAMTENAMAIPVDSEYEAQKMASALGSSCFSNIIKATKWGNFRIDWRMFKYFRKDFWKKFVD